jgi:lipoyl(octanoyl) transferase
MDSRGRPPAEADVSTLDDRPGRPAKTPRLSVFDLGIVPYEPLQQLQGQLRAAVADGLIPGVILLLEHEPVITLGNRRAPADLRDHALVNSRGVAVVVSERGGRATLHAPGQLVAYPIVSIPRHDLRAYVHGLEEVFAIVLGGYGVTAQRREGHPGLYVHGDKIMSVGLRCHRWVTSHGTSFNVSVDLSLFDLVVSCGETQLRQTSLQAVTGGTHDMPEVKAACLEAFCRVFDWRIAPLRALSYDGVEEALGLGAPLKCPREDSNL